MPTLQLHPTDRNCQFTIVNSSIRNQTGHDFLFIRADDTQEQVPDNGYDALVDAGPFTRVRYNGTDYFPANTIAGVGPQISVSIPAASLVVLTW